MPETALTPIQQRDQFAVRDELESALAGAQMLELAFPQDIAEIDYWMCFRVNKAEFTRRNDFPVKNDISRIFLPLPANLGTQYSHSYNAEGIGVAGMAGAASGQNIANAITGAGSIQSIIDQITSINTKDLVNAGGYYGLQAAEEAAAAIGTAIGASVGGPAGAIFGGVGGAVGGQFVKGAIAGAGLARNPYMALMYDSPQFRTHQFSWKLMARSLKETNAIREIIRKFKFYSAPGMNQNNPHFFDYPHQFDIDFHYEGYLFNIAPSVLTSFEVNYHSEGQPLYHDVLDEANFGDEYFPVNEKAPVSITINASFQEVSIVTKESIERQNR
jgi:hypothetical protein